MRIRSFNANRRMLHFENDLCVYAELACTPEKRERGLMFVESLGDNDGMLFEYEHPEALSFWMKNTLIPLAIAFIDYTAIRQGVIIDIQEMEPQSSYLHKAPQSVPAALEVNSGWFARNKIAVGDQITW